MRKERRTTNASNWTGKEVEYFVLYGGEQMEVFGYKFIIVKDSIDTYKVEDERGQVFCTVLIEDEQVTAFNGYCSRSGVSLHEAVAKLAANLY